MTFGTFFLPGPTEVRPEVLQAMTRPMISHRSAEFRSVFARLQDGLRVVFDTTRPVFIATCSATGLMEAAVRNAPSGSVLALVNGGFSERFAEVAARCGRRVERYDVALGKTHDPAIVLDRARGHALVTVVHSETSTGALNPVRAISDAAHEAGAVCAIDSVTGIRGAELHVDAWGLDFVFTGSQKAIALPPGLAFAVASESFLAGASDDRRGVYLDLADFAKAAAKNEAPNTPALPLYFALDVQLPSIVHEGMTASWARHAEMSAMTTRWAEGLGLGVVAAPGERSPTVTAVRVPDGLSSAAIVKAVAAEGFTIGSGYGQLKDTTVRIGHMGDHTASGLARLLAVCASVVERMRDGGRLPSKAG